MTDHTATIEVTLIVDGQSHTFKAYVGGGSGITFHNELSYQLTHGWKTLRSAAGLISRQPLS